MSAVLQRQLSSWGLQVSSEAEESLLSYARILSSYDKANVIGTRDVDEILRRHVLDSLSCLLFSSFEGATKVADVGSGGGLPGIPLAIALPDTEVMLFESVGKKAAFLEYAARELALQNVVVVNGRVEEAGRRGSHRGAYDLCTVRAVGRLSVLAEYCLPLLRVGGYVVAMKGRRDEREWAEAAWAAGLLGGRLLEDIEVRGAPDEEERERRLVLFEKVAQTPGVYPRRTGVPVQRPLGGP